MAGVPARCAQRRDLGFAARAHRRANPGRQPRSARPPGGHGHPAPRGSGSRPDHGHLPGRAAGRLRPGAHRRRVLLVPRRPARSGPHRGVPEPGCGRSPANAAQPPAPFGRPDHRPLPAPRRGDRILVVGRTGRSLRGGLPQRVRGDPHRLAPAPRGHPARSGPLGDARRLPAQSGGRLRPAPARPDPARCRRRDRGHRGNRQGRPQPPPDSARTPGRGSPGRPAGVSAARAARAAPADHPFARFRDRVSQPGS